MHYWYPLCIEQTIFLPWLVIPYIMLPPIYHQSINQAIIYLSIPGLYSIDCLFSMCQYHTVLITISLLPGGWILQIVVESCLEYSWPCLFQVNFWFLLKNIILFVFWFPFFDRDTNSKKHLCTIKKCECNDKRR